MNVTIKDILFRWGKIYLDNSTLLLIIYIIMINFSGFFTMGFDKYKAKKNKWRIPEKELYLLALMGGSVGVYLGMRKFRHKTKHLSFIYGIPLLIVCNVVVYYIIITKYIL